MFWDFAYTPSKNIEELLKKEELKLEELLDDDDILQECKVSTKPLLQYLTRPDNIKKLVELITTEPSDEIPISERFKYPNMACEILTSGIPSLDEKLVEDSTYLQILYSFLEREPPLNPILSSYFSKTFSTLISKKAEQDWFLHLKMCLQVLEFIKSQENFLDLVFKHFTTPVIVDLLLHIIKEFQNGDLKNNLNEWLFDQQLVNRLIKLLANHNEIEKQNNAADFICDLIKHGRSIRQSERENDSFVENNLLLQFIENKDFVQQLLDAMFESPKQEGCIVSGIIILLSLVDESIVDKPASEQALQIIIDKEKENHEMIVSIVIQNILVKINDFHELLINPPKKNDITTTVSNISPPFGRTRLHVCRLFTVLLQTGNQEITDAICDSGFFNTLLDLFKQYCWNNFLHSEVEKCIQFVFATFDQNDNEKECESLPTNLQNHVIADCKIISKLIDCWMLNKNIQSKEKGNRLGYMGHLIKILKDITQSVLKSKSIGALISSNLSENELDDWIFITENENEFKKEIDTQSKWLANIDPDHIIDSSIPTKDYNNEICNSEISNENEANYDDEHELEDVNNELCHFQKSNHLSNCFDVHQDTDDNLYNPEHNLKIWENVLEDHYGNFRNFSGSDTLNMVVNPWTNSAFSETINTNDPSSGWSDFGSDNFANFDAHFNSFSSDLGDEINPNFENSDFIIKSDTKIINEYAQVLNANNIDAKNAKNLNLNVENEFEDNSDIQCSENEANYNVYNTDIKELCCQNDFENHIDNKPNNEETENATHLNNDINLDQSTLSTIFNNELKLESTTVLESSTNTSDKIDNLNDNFCNIEKQNNDLAVTIKAPTVLKNGPV